MDKVSPSDCKFSDFFKKKNVCHMHGTTLSKTKGKCLVIHCISAPARNRTQHLRIANLQLLPLSYRRLFFSYRKRFLNYDTYNFESICCKQELVCNNTIYIWAFPALRTLRSYDFIRRKHLFKILFIYFYIHFWIAL